MANQQAGGRRPFPLGWTLQVLLWGLGAMALFLARAIDFGAQRYPVYFTYSTPLYLRDVLGMIARARPTDFLVPTLANAILWTSVLSALVLILDRRRRIRSLWRLIIVGPQGYLFGLFALYGLSSLVGDLPRLLIDRLDGEWLGEGWHQFEADALWMITIVILLLQLLPPWTWRWIWPLGEEPQGEPAGSATEATQA
jgi:hypothetical protein